MQGKSLIRVCTIYIWNLFLIHFVGPKQQDCQKNDGIDISNVGARTTAICQNEKGDENKQNVLSRCFVTEFSSDQKKACVFPFRLQGASEDHNSCTNLFDPDGRYWCSTQVIQFNLNEYCQLLEESPGANKIMNINKSKIVLTGPKQVGLVQNRIRIKQ